MNLNDINKYFFPIIKVISIVLITTTIGLELWTIYANLNNSNIPSNLNPFLWVGTFAIVAHLIEAVIAAFYATSRNQTPIKYGIYTFFVGTVGLLELFNGKDANN
jgi:hypothetical protein